MTLFYDILLPLKFDYPFTYISSIELQVGQLVKVPFRNSVKLGVVVAANSNHKSSLKIKEIEKAYEIFFNINLLTFIDWVAKYNLAQKGMILKMLLSINKHLDGKYLPVIPPQFEKMLNETPLSLEQQQACDFILAHKETILLDGVTGSGKTEVYLKVAAKMFEKGKQVLILLPEILLTTQLIERFEDRLGIKPVVWHSGISVKQKKQNWRDIYHNHAKLIVGARSALFLPFADLQLIIIDEEHDQSYKQEEGVIYNARDMAIVKGKIENIPVVLASATPSVETIYNVNIGKYKSRELRSRFGEATMPELQLIDLNIQKLPKKSWISKPLRGKLAEMLDKGQQSLLFLNRRGYAPVTFCGNCKTKIECPNCNFLMVEHRNRKCLQCHYCGYAVDIILKCPTCGSNEKMLMLGPGVERIAEEVQQLFGDARIALFTSDTIVNHQVAEEVIQNVMNQEVDIVIGTQMISKGLHFPKLNLVGIIEADKNFLGGDIRTLERTYQLLHQVAGRAGREKEKGLVMLQTYQPESVVLQQLVNGSRDGFYEAELADRREAEMPPFSRLAIVSFQSFMEKSCIDFGNDLARHAPNYENIIIMGPAPAPIFLLRRQYRYRFIIKASLKINLQQVIEDWLRGVKIPASVRVKVDIDPYSFA